MATCLVIERDLWNEDSNVRFAFGLVNSSDKGDSVKLSKSVYQSRERCLRTLLGNKRTIPIILIDLTKMIRSTYPIHRDVCFVFLGKKVHGAATEIVMTRNRIDKGQNGQTFATVIIL